MGEKSLSENNSVGDGPIETNSGTCVGTEGPSRGLYWGSMLDALERREKGEVNVQGRGGVTKHDDLKKERGTAWEKKGEQTSGYRGSSG